VSAVRVRAAANGHEREVSIADGSTVVIGDARYAVERLDSGSWRVTANGRGLLVHVVPDDDGCWVHVDGRVHRIELTHGGARPRKRPRAVEHGLSAPMPATVLSIVAPVGQAVRSGDVVLMLEAMKMELAVRAPRDGVVTAVHCRAGELVQPGVTLVEIE
jgi:3-methylcrotonyl-CoA carboxylase alpha subunit